MRFGLFSSAHAPRGGSPAARAAGFHDFVETNVEAEALGYHASFVVEHHFTGAGQISATLQLLTWIAARTTRLRLGTAVLVLPWHNPVLLAEQIATLDLLSGGRVDCGVGKGYRHNEFAGFCINSDEAEARFAEALDLLVKAWTSDARFSHAGRFWRFAEIVVEPQPFQRPHPPLWMAAGSAASIRAVAQRGANLLLDQFAMPDAVAEKIALFKAETEAQGRCFDPMSVAVARNLYVARDAADREAALERQAKVHERMVALSRRPGEDGQGSHILAYADRPGGTEESAFFGTPDDIARQLDALHAAGARYVLLNGGTATRQSLRRFAREIMPGFA